MLLFGRSTVAQGTNEKLLLAIEFEFCQTPVLSSVQKTRAIGLHWDLENEAAGPADRTEPTPPRTLLWTEAAKVSAVPLRKLQHRHLKSTSFPLFSTVNLTAMSSKTGFVETKGNFWPC